MADGEDRPTKPGRTAAEIASIVVVAMVAIGALIVFFIVGQALR